MDLYHSFLDIIYSIKAEEVILALYGLLLLTTSFVKSSYGIYSFSGALALCAGIAVRVLSGGNIAQLFIIVFIYLSLITVLFLLSVRFSKYDWIMRMPLTPVSEGVKEIRLSGRR